MIILCIFNINYILLEISGSHSNIISDSYVFHYGNELVSRIGNKEIRPFIAAGCDQKYPFAPLNGCSSSSSSCSRQAELFLGVDVTFVKRQ